MTLPAVDYHQDGGGTAAKRLVRGLLNGGGSGELLVCPVGVDAEKHALRFVDWTREQDADTPSDRVRLVPEPTATVIGTRPGPGETAGLVLVVPRGTSRQLLADSTALLATWRPVDAVVVVS